MRVVADTNIFISAFMFGGLPATFLDLAFTGAFTLVTSPAILDELDEKLRGKFELSVEQAQKIRWKLEGIAQVVDSTITLSVVKEDSDD